MVSFVVITHSETLALGIIEEAKMMAPNVTFIPAGGGNNGELGTSAEKIEGAIKQAYSDDGVILLFDMGSAVITAEMVVDDLSDEGYIKTYFADCPILEGAVTGGVLAEAGENVKDIVSELLEVGSQRKIG